MEKRFAVFISVLLSAIIIITSDIIVDYRYRNSFNEWIQYQVPQTAKAYKKIQQDFHYTMDNDAIIPKKFDFTYEKNSIFHEDENKDAYFMQMCIRDRRYVRCPSGKVETGGAWLSSAQMCIRDRLYPCVRGIEYHASGFSIERDSICINL